MRLEALLFFCHPHLKGPDRELTIENADVCSSLEQAANFLDRDLPSMPLIWKKKRTQKIQATIKEIRTSIETFRKPNNASISNSPCAR